MRPARPAPRTRPRPACRTRSAPPCRSAGARARRPGARRARRPATAGSASTSASGAPSRSSASGSMSSIRSGRRIAVRDRELDQAQQRAVAALAHELGVEREPPGLRARPSAIAVQVGRARPRRDAHGLAPGSSHSTLSRPARPGGRRRCRARGSTRAGAEQAALSAWMCWPQYVFRKA